jgi:flagellar basal-body rod modification protein FlgD
LLRFGAVIPPSLIVSAASSALGLVSSLASSATAPSDGSGATSGTGATNGTGATSGTGAAAAKKNDVVNQAEFMKLLIAQLQNQDPMNPLDSANFSSQLAQFSSLEQLTQINQKISDQATQNAGRFDAVSFIGRDVTGPSGAIEVKDGTATTLDYSLAAGGAVRAKIVNASGDVVADLQLGDQGAGDHTLDLGQASGVPHLDDGVYTVALTQADPTGNAAAVDTRVTGRVTGVDLTGDAPTLLLGGRRLGLGDVTTIRQPADPAA